MPWLFDTSAISETVRKRPDPDYLRWLAGVPRSQQHTSILVLGELHVAACLSKGPGKWQRLLEEQIAPRLTVLGLDDETARRYGQVQAELRRLGGPIGDVDVWIAASALRHGLGVVTMNVRHFERVPGLRLKGFGGRAGG